MPTVTHLPRRDRFWTPSMIVFVVLAALIALLPFLAAAQDPAAAADFDPMAIITGIVHAVQGKQWPVVGVLVFVAVTWVARRIGMKAIPWLGTSEGGTVLALLTTSASVLGAAALGGVPVTWTLLWQALGAAFTAIGGYVGVRRLLRIIAPLLATKVPWLAKLLA
jgi:hypothetical protein